MAHVSVSRPFISATPRSNPRIFAEVSASIYRGIRTAAMTLMMTSVAMSSIKVNPLSPMAGFLKRKFKGTSPASVDLSKEFVKR